VTLGITWTEETVVFAWSPLPTVRECRRVDGEAGLSMGEGGVLGHLAALVQVIDPLRLTGRV